ncbi:MAG: ABC transporter, partial [Cyanobacteria bacterium J083]
MFKSKYSKYLLWIGITLIIAGIVSLVVSTSLVGNGTKQPLNILPIALIIAGIALIIWYGKLRGLGEVGFWQRPATISIINSLIATFAFLIVLALINFLTILHPVRIDLTENQLLTLSPASQALVRNLSQPVKVLIFDYKTNPEDKKLLQDYRRYSDKFSYEYVDPDRNITLREKFGVKAAGEVHIEAGDKRQLLTNLSLGKNLSEAEISNGIARILRDRQSVVYFLQGHGEAALENVEGGYSQAVKALQDRGYQVKPLNLATTPQIPESADVIIIAGAKRKFFPPEITALQNYLAQGGSLLLLIDPQTDPGFTPILQEWGIKLDNRLVIDPTEKLVNLDFGPAVPIINTYGTHPIVKDFGNSNSIYPGSRPIETLEAKGVKATSLVVTKPETWAESNLNSEAITFDAKEDISGPLDLAVALTRQSQDNSKKESRLVVFGSSTFASNGWFQQQLNGDIFLNSVDWLA